MRAYIFKPHWGKKFEFVAGQKKMLIKEIRILEFITFSRQDTLLQLIFQTVKGETETCCYEEKEKTNNFYVSPKY